MVSNIFVLGLDDENRRTLEVLPGADELRFHPLLTVDDLVGGEIDLAQLLADAERELDAFEGPIDAIVGYWDFPVSSMVPILCQRRGLPSASLESVLKCEHKYWSRLQQRASIEEYPAFGLVALHDEAPPEGLRYPLWLKPVKAFSSELAFHVDSDEQFRQALEAIREGIGRIGGAFDVALSYVDLPAEIEEAGGQAVLAEEAVSGKQITVEGYNDGRGVRVYGVVDSYNYPGTSSFLRYQYPSALPQPVIQRLTEVTERVIAHVDLRSVFNIEYFWNEDSDEVTILEINPRQSQSHAMLFDQVDGVAHHQCMVQMALGRDPELPYRQGPYAVAAKWFYRRFTDAVVRRCPTGADIARIEREIPGVHVELVAQQGDRLSELPGQDSYSYAVAVVHAGAQDETQLREKYERCIAELPFEFTE